MTRVWSSESRSRTQRRVFTDMRGRTESRKGSDWLCVFLDANQDYVMSFECRELPMTFVLWMVTAMLAETMEGLRTLRKRIITERRT
jgi:hypothetical protein